MAFPVSGSPFGAANPSPAYTANFIPEIWSSKLIEKFYDACVLAAISNTDYEGEIKSQGDKIIIRTKPTITIRTYEANQTLTLERPTSTKVEMLIDKGHYFNTIIDDVLEVQSDLKQLSMWADDASEQIKIVVDRQVLRTIAADTVAANKGATAGRISGDINLGVTAAPIVITPATVLDLIVDMGIVLDEQNISEQNRWLVIPAWMAGMLKKSDLKDASITGDNVSVLRNGRLGMIDRFTLYGSNLLPAGVADSLAAGEFNIFAGHSHGLSFAAQMTKTETLRSESAFGTIMRGLEVHGSKVLDGTALVSSVVKKG